MLHRRFYELEGQGWRQELVVPEGRRKAILQCLHGGAIGAHLGMARTLTLAEQGFYWPGMRADVNRICTECDCAMCSYNKFNNTSSGPDGTPCNGCGWTVPHHFHRKPVLPDGGMLFLKMAQVFPHSGPEGHKGRSEASIRDCGALWNIPGVA